MSQSLWVRDAGVASWCPSAQCLSQGCSPGVGQACTHPKADLGPVCVCCVWCEPALKFTYVGVAGEIRSLPVSVKQLTTWQTDGFPQLEWANAEADLPESHFFCNIVIFRRVVQWGLHAKGVIHGVNSRRWGALRAPQRLPLLTCEHKSRRPLINTPHYYDSRLNSSKHIGLFFWAYCLVSTKIKNKIYLGGKRRRKGITITLIPPCINTCIFALVLNQIYKYFYMATVILYSLWCPIFLHWASYKELSMFLENFVIILLTYTRSSLSQDHLLFQGRPKVKTVL